MNIQSVKNRFGIIGSSSKLDHVINIAMQVAPTDISVLIAGESGTGKESFPKIIHHYGSRKHGPYIAVNCGAIPEGTIDSELFGHEKGSFTGAHDARKGYFEEGNGGTIFLDEIAELPIATQARLLRVLETGDFMRVGSSKPIKTNVRVVAATNVNMPDAIADGKFREDLYYRLNTVPIMVPPLRERDQDSVLLFRKFAADFAERYRMPVIKLDEGAKNAILNYRWPGNVRQLKNIAEQISILEKERNINAEVLLKYLPQIKDNKLPVLFQAPNSKNDISERDLLYKVLFDMRKDITDLKKLVNSMLSEGSIPLSMKNRSDELLRDIEKQQSNESLVKYEEGTDKSDVIFPIRITEEDYHEGVIIEESLSIQEKEIDLIKKALEKHGGKRKYAAKELGISERTLYRKLKENNIK